eukprot:m.5272 g.5272  ORF g.5272 m.5272 type:complete len:173 (+) comp5378_c0_seq2:10-528(+)
MMISRALRYVKADPAARLTFLSSFATKSSPTTTLPGMVQHNRNPRNPELLGAKRFRVGFSTTQKSLQYYHRLQVHFSNQHITAQVSHENGNVILTTTTKEQPIAAQLYSKSDKSAARNIGRVMAQRMKESGIVCVFWDRQGRAFHGKNKEFITAIRNGGITLREVDKRNPRY